MRFQKGELLFQRRGHLNAVRQDFDGSFCLDRAPRRRGIWAFPWPWSDPFFSHHKFWEAMPKRLAKGTANAEWEAILAKYEPLLANATEAETRRIYQQMFAEHAPFEEKLEAEQNRWIRKQGRKHVPLRQFWYGGQLYSHLDGRGNFLGMDNWALVTAAEFYRAARRYERRVTDRDPLEVFIPANGKLR